MREPRKTERRYHLQDAEDPQAPANAALHEPDSAHDTARETRAECGGLGDHADLRARKTDVEKERGGQRGRHRVTELVQKDEAEYEQRAAPAVALNEFLERL